MSEKLHQSNYTLFDVILETELYQCGLNTLITIE